MDIVCHCPSDMTLQIDAGLYTHGSQACFQKACASVPLVVSVSKTVTVRGTRLHYLSPIYYVLHQLQTMNALRLLQQAVDF